MAVGGAVCAGVCLLASSSENRLSKRLALPWIAVGIGVGELVGAGVDHMLVGVAGGAAIGLLLSAIRLRTRS